ncbi:hypothetical protein [Paenibacillus hexagrammi]|uniref:Uncharacterized protein n=1 Tax=Paenibacillus hexagrammi TaxID=2908839 RepID=A0ABY3SFJ6_9BACL|nr:hypothetical protein [Paenibacillus sp. YPD9-1]UJF31855.1 hypothetical protein L0M14_19095 [Paenibacillus sp. YPD9-1]
MDILNNFGIDAMYNAAYIDTSKIEEFAAKGFVCMSDIRQYREIIDVKLKFYLMELSKEQAMFSFNKKGLMCYPNGVKVEP